MTDQFPPVGVIVLAAFLLAGSCQVLGNNTELATEGTVALRDIEGGCWVIETESETYEPVSLPSEFREDGLRVSFAADVKENAVSFCQVGPVIELREIERAD